MNSHNSEPEREVYRYLPAARHFFTLFLEQIRIQLPSPGMPSHGIELDVLIQLPRPGMPSLGIELDVLIQLPRPGKPSLGIELDVLIQLPRPGAPSLGIEAHYFRAYNDALVQG